MRWCLIGLSLLLTAPSWSQTTTGTAETKGPCSPAFSGSNNRVVITCSGISDKLGVKLVDLLNRVAKNQIDAQTMMAKLDVCLQGVSEVREAQKPWRLGEDQKKQIKQLLNGIQAKVEVWSTTDSNAVLLAADLRDALGLPSSTSLAAANPFEGIVMMVSHTDFPEAALLRQSLETVIGIRINAEVLPSMQNNAIGILVGAKPQTTPRQ